ncbi:MAG: hypothetical protein HYV09_02105 [Deltaproteobacteria bacterium]|nr:hypothetical protein [Deltaproteobacteria bacterium]
MPTRRELMERADARLRTRGGEEGALEASRCFLRAMLMGIDDGGAVPDDLVARVGEFLAIDHGELMGAAARPSTRPPPSSVMLQAVPGERLRRVLVLGRGDGGRVAMLDAVGRTMLVEEAELRAACLAPVAYDPRALRVLRLAGYATEGLGPRAVTVDDLTWADLVITVGGERDMWERFLPRSMPHQHEPIDDPIALTRGLSGEDDEHEAFRLALRVVERVLSALRPPRSSRLPVAPPSIRPSRSRISVAPPVADEEPRTRR